jgi:acyl transferase domain-containing protein
LIQIIIDMTSVEYSTVVSDDKEMPIAVVGMGCRFPGDATSPNKLWDLLMRKKSARGEIPADRFNIDAFYHPDGDRNGTVRNYAPYQYSSS